MLNYIKTKRGKRFPCNICQKTYELTYDHVPPKGGIELKSVEIENIFNHLTKQTKKREYLISQNGVKYRTICRNCNSLLGQKYDPVLNEFALGVGRILKSTIDVPSLINYETKPTSIIRAVLGHLLAAKAESDNVTIDRKIRTFLFDENKEIPEDIKVFYWIYPYKCVVIKRDFIMPSIRNTLIGHGFFNIIKYFPIAYLICNLTKYEGLQELTLYNKFKPDELARIPINLNNIRASLWPEKGELIAGGKSVQSSIYAIPRNIRNKKNT